MKRILDILFSSKTSIILLVILAIAMGTGTFIEDKYDTATARDLVYNAKWFELLFLLLAFNFIGHIKTFNMLRKERVGGVIFHLAFVVMIMGAGITRYFGFEGNMHIRKGEASNILYSSDPYLRISLTDKGKTNNNDFPVNFGPFSSNSFHTKISSEEKGKVDINCKEYIKNAHEKINENVAGGVDLIELIVATDNGKQRVYVEKGEIINIGKISIAFNNNKNKDAVQVTEKNGVLQIISPYDMLQSNMEETENDSIQKDI